MGGPALIDGKKFKEFDNFYICKFVVDDIEYHSSEQYFQAQKSDDPNFKKEILDKGKNAGISWMLGNQVKLREDWEKIKIDVMRRGNFEKINQNEDLKKLLVSTKGDIKFDRSSEFWNKWNAHILEELRLLFQLEEGHKALEEQDNE